VALLPVKGGNDGNGHECLTEAGLVGQNGATDGGAAVTTAVVVATGGSEGAVQKVNSRDLVRPQSAQDPGGEW